MSDPEVKIRAALSKRLQLARVPPVQAWDDEAVSEIMKAAGMAAGDVSPAVGPQAHEAAAMTAAAMLSAGKAVEFGALAREMLATFKQGPNGWSARVKADQVEEWRAKLGVTE